MAKAFSSIITSEQKYKFITCISVNFVFKKKIYTCIKIKFVDGPLILITYFFKIMYEFCKVWIFLLLCKLCFDYSYGISTTIIVLYNVVNKTFCNILCILLNFDQNKVIELRKKLFGYIHYITDIMSFWNICWSILSKALNRRAKLCWEFLKVLCYVLFIMFINWSVYNYVISKQINEIQW